MDVAQYMGLDMKDETTILAWRVEECDEFYFCGSVMYVYLTSAVAKKSHAVMLAAVFGFNEGYALNDLMHDGV